MPTVTDICSTCGEIILAGEGAALADAQVMHFFCYASTGSIARSWTSGR
jgi:hypothetical protein